MRHYIDAEKLIAEIEKYKQGAAIARFDNAGENADYFQGKIDLCDDLTHIIASLQQEPRFPQYDNIVDKVFGAGNLEGFEYHEAEMLVALAKEELLKSLQQEQPEVDLEKVEKASYKVFPAKKKLSIEKIKYPNREDENFSKREIWKDGVIWAIYNLGINARKKE